MEKKRNPELLRIIEEKTMQQQPAQPQQINLSLQHSVRVYKIADSISGILICLYMVLNPWLFGTTRPWEIWIMNILGYTLGVLLFTKWWIRFWYGYKPSRWSPPIILPKTEKFTFSKYQWPVIGLALLTVIILAYILISAINARCSYEIDAIGDYIPIFYECIKWLPHSLDKHLTWSLFFEYLGLACVFWATRDWLLGKTLKEKQINHGDIPSQIPIIGRVIPTKKRVIFPQRLAILLWVLSISGMLLGLESITQRLSNTNKLLWIRQLRFNTTAESQFGPYAYRSNAASYFNMLWPLCLGLWWVQRQAAKASGSSSSRIGAGPHVMLLPGAVLMAACPIISLSRGGAIVALLGLLAAFSIFLISSWKWNWPAKIGIVVLFIAIIGTAWYLGWDKLSSRFKTIFSDNLSNRIQIYENSRQIAKDYPIFGVGPGAFASVYHLYRKSVNETWAACLHDDWMETLVTFGRAGSSLVFLAFIMAILHWFIGRGLKLPFIFMTMVWIAIAGCLLHAKFDFPLQVHSLLNMFLFLCCISLSSSKNA